MIKMKVIFLKNLLNSYYKVIDLLWPRYASILRTVLSRLVQRMAQLDFGISNLVSWKERWKATQEQLIRYPLIPMASI
jgi:hypothetical protein